MIAFNTISSILSVINIDNIDTDQIIASDHLKTTSKEGLGQYLFSDWRYLADGTENSDFVLNDPKLNNSQIIVAGDNFGCGSSREHAPWALLDFGIRVVISSSMADIFSNNSVKNGLLTIQVSTDEHRYLLSKNGASIQVDLLEQVITCDSRTISFQIEPFAKYCLTNGFDQLDFLMEHLKDIEKYEVQL
ncbi:MAG: 3-isopropylmalate/(R)-2-methylmalate dehydratase small subunit [Polaribacter sp.]|jgi:3-isopropylmalate/(R)-2-methylmalate dehydratase small subunit